MNNGEEYSSDVDQWRKDYEWKKDRGGNYQGFFWFFVVLLTGISLLLLIKHSR